MEKPTSGGTPGGAQDGVGEPAPLFLSRAREGQELRDRNGRLLYSPEILEALSGWRAPLPAVRRVSGGLPAPADAPASADPNAKTERPGPADPWKAFVGLLAAGSLVLAFGVVVALFGDDLDGFRSPLSVAGMVIGLFSVAFAFAHLADSRPDWRQLLGNFLLNGIFALALALAALPLIAILRGATALLSQEAEHSPADVLGTALAFFALLLGSLFFAYSIKYYLGTGLVLLTTMFSPQANGNGKGKAKGHHGLSRIMHRGNGHNGNGNGNGHNGNGNGNGSGHFDLGYYPKVSIHVASYNEKRVIERLLTALSKLEYPNYEVVWVDDSTDETLEIIERWRSRERFKIIHRLSRDGYKGGALKEALAVMDPAAEYVCVFDADSVPFPDTIERFLPHFYTTNGNGRKNGDGRSGNGNWNGNGHGNATPKPRLEVAAVQSYQWHVLNKSESWLTEAVRTEYAGSYMIERPFQEALGGMKMVAGTAYMIRAELLKQIGWGRSLTEDWELTLRLYTRGYKVVYTPYAETPAECVGTFARLARQRMRWAEGHTHNIRRSFLPILLSPFISPAEKVEFVFYAVYYLQALFFIAGTLCWLVAEIGLHQHVPQWTALLGWSLLFSNALALPLMNLGGLLLEEAPGKDARGVLGAMGLSIALAPFQAWAALKGLIEKDEGPWYRTPKTGRVTDEVHHLRRLKLLGRWLLGPKRRNGNGPQPALVQAQPKPRLKPRRVGWIVIGAMALATAGLAWGSVNAPVAQAAGTALYLHGGTCPTTNGTMNTTAPSGAAKTWGLGTAGQTCKWATTSSTTAAQTIFSTDVFTFSFWAVRQNGAASPAISAVFGYSSSSTCSSVTTIATMPSYTFSVTTTDTNFTPPTFSPASDVSVPSGSFFCWSVTVQSADNKTSFEWDSSADNTNLNSTQTIFIPELVLAFAGVALLLPLALGRVGRLRRLWA